MTIRPVMLAEDTDITDPDLGTDTRDAGRRFGAARKLRNKDERATRMTGQQKHMERVRNSAARNDGGDGRKGRASDAKSIRTSPEKFNVYTETKQSPTD